MKTLCKNSLPAAWRTLVTLCEGLNFGYIEGLEIRSGAPESYAAAVKTVMPGPNKDNGPSAFASDPSAPLRPQWNDVFALAARTPDVRVRRLEVAHGIPLKLHIDIPGGNLHG